MVVREVPKPGGKGAEVRIVQMPVGYGMMPYSGGLMDQPAYLADAFAQFMSAERAVAMKQLSKGSGQSFGFDTRDPQS